MYYNASGIGLDTWATVGRGCKMMAEVRGPETQLELGPVDGRLNVALQDEESLHQLSELLRGVIERREATRPPESLDFRILEEPTARA